MEMKDRIQKFIDYKNISPGELSDILGVQRSNISHILNGRNKPGAAFIEKFLLSFPNVNARWLFTGEGPMIMNTDKESKSLNFSQEPKTEPVSSTSRDDRASKLKFDSPSKTIEKVVLLYSDGTFLSYNAE